MPQSPKKTVSADPVPASVLAKFLGLKSVEDLEAARAQGWVPDKNQYLALLHFFSLKKEAADARKARRRAAEKARRDRRGLQILEAALALVAAFRRVEAEAAPCPPMWFYREGEKEAKMAARKAARKVAEEARVAAAAAEDRRWKFSDSAAPAATASASAPKAA